MIRSCMNTTLVAKVRQHDHFGIIVPTNHFYKDDLITKVQHAMKIHANDGYHSFP